MAEDLKLRILAEAEQARNEFENLRQAGVRATREIGASSSSASKISQEAFATASSEIIESWGVDGDIANEIGKMLTALPPQVKVAMVAAAAAFVAGAAAVGVLIAAAKQVLEVSEKVGTKSRDDFKEFEKAVREAGFQITELDRRMAQQLQRSAKDVKSTFDGLFVIVLRESGPEFINFLNTVKQKLKDLEPAARRLGYILGEAFNFATAGLNTLSRSSNLIADAAINLSSKNPLLLYKGLKQSYEIAKVFADELDKARKAANKLNDDLPPATFTAKTGPDRQAARERAQRGIQRMLADAREDSIRSLRDDQVLRQSSDKYVAELDAKIAKRRGFVAILEGQAKNFLASVKAVSQSAAAVRDKQFQTAEIELRRLQSYVGIETIVIQAQAELRRQEEVDRKAAYEREIAQQLEANRITAADDRASREQKLEAQRQLNLLLEEEEKRHRAALDEINRSEQVDLERRNPLSPRSLFGDAYADEITASGNRLRALAAMGKDIFTQLSAQAGNFQTIAGSAVDRFARGLGGLVQAFIMTGRTGPAAMKQLTRAVLAEVAAQASVKAIFELAAGFSELFLNPPKAAAHFQAAALYGAAAGAAGLAAAAIGAPSAGGGALGSSLANSQSGDGGTREDRFRFLERDSRGRSASDIIITIKTDMEQSIANVERGLSASYQRGGMLKQITDNATSGIPITTS